MSVSETKSGYLFEPDQRYEGRKEAFNRTYGISRAPCPSGDLSVIPDADSSAVEGDAYNRFFASERAFKAPILQGRGGIIADDGRPCLEGNRRTRRQIPAGAK